MNRGNETIVICQRLSLNIFYMSQLHVGYSVVDRENMSCGCDSMNSSKIPILYTHNNHKVAKYTRSL